MKTKLFLIGLLIGILSGCINDYESNKIISPSKKYKIKAIVNRTDNNSKDYADVIISLYDKNDNLLNKINTGAGDFNKWHIGWTKKAIQYYYKVAILVIKRG